MSQDADTPKNDLSPTTPGDVVPAGSEESAAEKSEKAEKVEKDPRAAMAAAVGRIPSGLFILTAAYEERRAGILTSWVQQVCFEPLMVSVAVAKGRPIMPLVSDSRSFALCQVRADDKMSLRKFGGGGRGGGDVNDDPFLGIDLIPSQRGVPILRQSLGYMECEVAYHMDVDGDHDLFVGRVINGAYLNGDPFVHLRTNGLKY